MPQCAFLLSVAFTPLNCSLSRGEGLNPQKKKSFSCLRSHMEVWSSEPWPLWLWPRNMALDKGGSLSVVYLKDIIWKLQKMHVYSNNWPNMLICAYHNITWYCLNGWSTKEVQKRFSPVFKNYNRVFFLNLQIETFTFFIFYNF